MAFTKTKYVRFLEVNTCQVLYVELVYRVGQGDTYEHCTNNSKYR